MRAAKEFIGSDIKKYDSLAQRCLLFLRCLPIAELRRLELVTQTLHDLTGDGQKTADLNDLTVFQELRRRVSSEHDPEDLQATPPLNRRSMVAARFYSVFAGTGDKEKKRAQDTKKTLEQAHKGWRQSALKIRFLLALLVFLPAIIAAWGVSTVLPYHGSIFIEQLLVVISGILFAWVSVGFWVAFIGTLTLLRKRCHYLCDANLPETSKTIADDCKTALLFPICGEDMRRVSSGIFSVYQSLKKTGQIDKFDVFLLSDSGDPDAWINEEVFWRQLCRDLGEPGNIYYRRRRLNLKRKSGNIADFCRRFGANYRYMVVFDADSIMAGSTLVRMVQLMENNKHVGILQTPPSVVGRETLLARMQQFASRAYGPIYAAGLHTVQQGDGSFWGHNAILRVEPFMQHCGLPRLSGKAPWGGDILSHDFVESALMRRAGYSIWLVYDLGGSYEEPPPTLLDELKRDRRWCSGNLQHLRLIFAEGLSSAHRWLFLNGIMSYLSAALWFSLLLLSSLLVVVQAFSAPEYFPHGRSLFPQWPVWDPLGPAILLSLTAILLFLPKVMALFVIAKERRLASFGGWFGLLSSVLGEILLSAFLAPIRMFFHTRFVFMMLLKRQSGWNPQNRADAETSWREAVQCHGSCTFVAGIWCSIMLLVNPLFCCWLAPVLVPMLLSIPLSVMTSRSDLGRYARNLKFFLIPEEVAPPAELVTLVNKQQDIGKAITPLRLQVTDGFVRAVLNPQINQLHRRLRGRMTRSKVPAAKRFILMRKALNNGPEGLSSVDKKRILQDNLLLWMLHKSVWGQPDGAVAQRWFGRYTHRAL
jgi:membrane glycosyltransferase